MYAKLWAIINYTEQWINPHVTHSQKAEHSRCRRAPHSSTGLSPERWLAYLESFPLLVNSLVSFRSLVASHRAVLLPLFFHLTLWDSPLAHAHAPHNSKAEFHNAWQSHGLYFKLSENLPQKPHATLGMPLGSSSGWLLVSVWGATDVLAER